MAEVVPTRGMLYDPVRAGPLDALVAPPYDVVSETERSALAAKSPYNIGRIALPEGARGSPLGGRRGPPPGRRARPVSLPPGLLHLRARTHAQGFHRARPSAQVRGGRGAPARPDPLGPTDRPAGAGAPLPHPPVPGV